MGNEETGLTPRPSVMNPFAWDQAAPLARGNSRVLVCTSLIMVESSNLVRRSPGGSGPWARFPLGVQRGGREETKGTDPIECRCGTIRTCAPEPEGKQHEAVREGPSAESYSASPTTPREAIFIDDIGEWDSNVLLCTLHIAPSCEGRRERITYNARPAGQGFPQEELISPMRERYTQAARLQEGDEGTGERRGKGAYVKTVNRRSGGTYDRSCTNSIDGG